MMLPLNPRVTWTERCCGPVQGTVRTAIRLLISHFSHRSDVPLYGFRRCCCQQSDRQLVATPKSQALSGHSAPPRAIYSETVVSLGCLVHRSCGIWAL